MSRNSNPPSKVIHFSSVNQKISQTDIIGVCQEFGKLSNIVMMKNKSQALVEFVDLADSIAFINNYTNYYPTIRGIVVYPSYSLHQELISSTNNIAASIQNTSPPSPVLLISILNPLYPITVEVLCQIFNQYNGGQVEKIIIFNSTKGSGNLQALIKFSSEENATNGREALQGKNIYSNCCTLQIQYSNNKDITIKENSDKSFDFTNPLIPKRESGAPLFIYLIVIFIICYIFFIINILFLFKDSLIKTMVE
jgi:hnRNP-L/PTB/hephaestus splicing factor